MAQYSGAISIPIYERLRFFAATVVVPLPTKGSRTISPSCEKHWIKSYGSWLGNVAGCSCFSLLPSPAVKYSQIVPRHFIGLMVIARVAMRIPFVRRVPPPVIVLPPCFDGIFKGSLLKYCGRSPFRKIGIYSWSTRKRLFHQAPSAPYFL